MKRKLINSFMLLSFTTLISKIFSLVNRMMLTRLLSIELFSLYILILPTMSLCSTIAQLSIPSAVFRLVSHPHYHNPSIIKTAFHICFKTCLIVIIMIILFAYPLSHYLLKEALTFYPILCFIPFIIICAFNSIIKNYFLGKQKHFILSIAQLIEEISRLLSCYFFITYFNNDYLLCLIMLAMSIGEIMSMIYLILNLKHYSLKEGTYIYKELLNISIPLTGSRLLHSLYNFIEPVILVTFLNMNKSLIHIEYAIISGYVISLLFTPTFFNNVILRLIIPIFNQDIVSHNHKRLQNHLLISLICSLMISLPFTLIFYFYPKECLLLLYNTTDGYQYLKYMSIPFILCYLQTPLTALLQSLNKNKDLFILSILEIFIEMILLIVLMPYFKVLTVGIVMLIGLLTTLVISTYKIYCLIF